MGKRKVLNESELKEIRLLEVHGISNKPKEEILYGDLHLVKLTG